MTDTMLSATLRLGTLDGRAVLIDVDGSRCLDVFRASEGKFGPSPQQVYEDWSGFTSWATEVDPGTGQPFDRAALEAPSPSPRQVFAIGLNYRDHAAEAGLDIPDLPITFTKFPTCLAGPVNLLRLPTDTVDWEAELVIVIGRRAHRVSVDDAPDHVAGAAVGQDYSERTLQLSGPAPQFSMAKSYPGFGAVGPWLTTIDVSSLALEIHCSINGDTVQRSNTAEMIFSVAELVSWLSAITPLLPGDLIFTGTPAGVGAGRRPRRFLCDGDVVETTIEGLGSLTQTCRSSPGAGAA